MFIYCDLLGLLPRFWYFSNLSHLILCLCLWALSHHYNTLKSLYFFIALFCKNFCPFNNFLFFLLKEFPKLIPNMRGDPSMSYYKKKHILGSKRDNNGYILFVNDLSKMTFLHLKYTSFSTTYVSEALFLVLDGD
jgi:hypothetical protein